MLILAREVVFADRPPDTVEHFKQLAVGVQCLALTASEASRSQERRRQILGLIEFPRRRRLCD